MPSNSTLLLLISICSALLLQSCGSGLPEVLSQFTYIEKNETENNSDWENTKLVIDSKNWIKINSKFSDDADKDMFIVSIDSSIFENASDSAFYSITLELTRNNERLGMITKAFFPCNALIYDSDDFNKRGRIEVPLVGASPILLRKGDKYIGFVINAKKGKENSDEPDYANGSFGILLK